DHLPDGNSGGHPATDRRGGEPAAAGRPGGAAGGDPVAAGGARAGLRAGRPAPGYLRPHNRGGGRGDMRRITVPLPREPYDVVIGSGILTAATVEFVRGRGERSAVALVTDEQVGPLYAGALAGACREALGGAPIAMVTVPFGEAAKS